MNLKDIRKRESIYNLGKNYKYSIEEEITYYVHAKMIVGVRINFGNKSNKYWNNTKEVLVEAIHNGYVYTLGLDEYRTERSLIIRINNFVKYILNDKDVNSKVKIKSKAK